MNEEQLGFNFAIEIDKTISDKNIQNYINEANKKFSFDFGINIDLKEITNVAEKLKTLNNTDAVIESPKIDTKSIVDSFSEVEGQVQKVTVNMDKLNNTTSKTVSYLMSTGKSLTQVLNADDTVRSQKLVIDEVKKQNEQLKLQKEAKNELIAKEKELANLRVQYANSKGDAESETISLQIQEKSMEYTNRRIQLEQQGLVTKETEIELDNILVQNQEKLARISSQQQDKSDQISAKELARQQEVERSAKLELEYQQKSLEVRLKKLTGGKNADFIEDPAKIAKVTKAIQELDGATKKEIAEKARTIAKEIDSIGTDANAKRIDELGKSVGGMGFSFSDLTKAVSGAMIIREFYQALKSGLKDVVAMNDAMTTLSLTMSDMSETKIDGLIKSSQQMAKDLSANVSSVLESVKTVANANETVESILAKSKPAVVLSNLTGLDTSVTVDAIQGAVKAFDDLAGGTEADAMRVADAMVSISKSLSMDFAEGIQGMTNSLSTIGSLANQVGMSIESTLGTVSAVAESTRLSFDEVSNGLRNVMARTLRLKSVDESVTEDDMLKTEKALNSVGVTIRGVGGTMRDFDDIMYDLAGTWSHLSAQEQQYVSDAMGGAQRISQVIALVSEYQRVQELTTIAINGTGSAMEAQELWSESLTAKTQALTNSMSIFWQTLVNSDAYGSGIEMLTNLISGITTLMDTFGSAPVIILAFGAVLTLVSEKFRTLNSSILLTGANMVGLGSKTQGATTLLKSAGVAMDVAKVKAIALQSVMSMGLMGAISLVTTGVTKLISSFKNADEKLEDTRSKAENLKSTFENLTSGIKSSNSAEVLINQYDRLSQSIDKISPNTTSYKEQLEELNNVKSELLSLFPTAISGYDDEGNAVLTTADNLKELNAQERESLRIQREMAKTEAMSNITGVTSDLEEEIRLREKALDDVKMWQDYMANTDLTDLQKETYFKKISDANEEAKKHNETVIQLQAIQREYNTILGITNEKQKENNETLNAQLDTAQAVADAFSSINTGDIALSFDSSEIDNATESYVELIKKAEDVKSVINDINNEGLTLDSLSDASKYMADFEGSINNTSEVIEHLNDILRLTENEANLLYGSMLSNDKNFWSSANANSNEYFNNNIANTENWAKFQQDTYNQLLKIDSIMNQSKVNNYNGYFKTVAESMQKELANAKNLNEAKLAIATATNEAIAQQQQALANAMADYAGDMYGNGEYHEIGGSYAGQFNTASAKSAIVEIQKWKNSALATIKGIDAVINSAPAFTSAIGSTAGATSNASSATEKYVKDLEELADRYYEIDRAVTKVNNALELNQTKQENATASEKVKLLNEELDLMKDKQKLLAELNSEQQKEAEILKQTLQSNGFTFDGSDISNYQKRLQELQNKANKITNPDEKEEAITYVESLMDVIKRYTELTLEEIPKINNEWHEMSNEIKQAQRDIAEYTADLQEKLSDAITQQLEKQTESLKKEIEKQKQILNDAWDEEDWEDSLLSEQRKLDEIQQQINNLSRDTSQAGQLKLQQLMAEYEAQKLAIDEMIKQNERDQSNDRFDEALQDAEDKLEEALDPENLAQLVNQALTSGFIELDGVIYETENLLTTMLENSGEAFTALGSILKSELIDQLETVKGLIGSIGSLQLSSSTITGRNIDMSELTGRSMGQQVSVMFNESLMNVEGNITEDVLPTVQNMIADAKDKIVYEISRALQTT